MSGISCDTTMKDLTLRLLDYLKTHGEDSVNHTRLSLRVNKNELIDTFKEADEYFVKKVKNSRVMHEINPKKLEFLNLLSLGPNFDEIIKELKLFLENSQEKITDKELKVIDIFINCVQAHQAQCSYALSSPLSDKVLKEFALDEYEKCFKIIGLVISLLQKIDSGLAHRYSLSLVVRLGINEGSIDKKWNDFKKIFTDQSSY